MPKGLESMGLPGNILSEDPGFLDGFYRLALRRIKEKTASGNG